MERDESSKIVEDDVLRCIRDLDGEDLVTLPMLAEAWPGEYSTFFQPSRRTQNSARNAHETTEGSEVATVPALTRMSLKSVFDRPLEMDDTCELESLLGVPGMMHEMKTMLRQRTKLSDAEVTLLIQIFAIELQVHPSHLDLSDFCHCLSTEKVLEVVSSCNTDLTVLNISNHNTLDINTLKEILRTAPRLKRLILVGCTSLVNEDIYSLQLSEPRLFLHMEAFIHHAFLDVEDELISSGYGVPYPCVFNVVVTCNDHAARCQASLPFFTPAQVIQGIGRYLNLSQSRSRTIMDYGIIAAQVSFSSASQLSGEDWGQRSITGIPFLSGDVILGKLAGWLFFYGQNQIVYRGPAANNWAFIWCTPKFPSQSSTRESDGRVESTVVEDSSGPSGENPQRLDKDIDRIPFDYEIYDLQGFIRVTTEQGRPVPPDDVVRSLSDILSHKTEAGTQAFRLMDHEEVAHVLLETFLRAAGTFQ